jgi:hypothetical protein
VAAGVPTVLGTTFGACALFGSPIVLPRELHAGWPSIWDPLVSFDIREFWTLCAAFSVSRGCSKSNCQSV